MYFFIPGPPCPHIKIVFSLSSDPKVRLMCVWTNKLWVRYTTMHSLFDFSCWWSYQIEFAKTPKKCNSEKPNWPKSTFLTYVDRYFLYSAGHFRATPYEKYQKPLILAFEVIGSIALLSHNTLKWSAILGLSYLNGPDGAGNSCYGVHACLVNFKLHFQKC